MNTKDLVEQITFAGFISEEGRVNPNCYKLVDRYPELLMRVNESTMFLTDAPLNERLYCVYNGISTSPSCVHCGNTVKFVAAEKRYLMYCCVKCVHASPERRARISETLRGG